MEKEKNRLFLDTHLERRKGFSNRMERKKGNGEKGSERKKEG